MKRTCALLLAAAMSGAAWLAPARADTAADPPSADASQSAGQNAQDAGRGAQDWQKFARDIQREVQDEVRQGVEQTRQRQQDLSKLTEQTQRDAERQTRRAAEQARRQADEFMQNHWQDLKKMQDLAHTEAMVAMSDMGMSGRSAQQRLDSGDNGGGDTSVNEHRPLNAGGEVYVNVVSGSLVVSAWERSEVQITGDLGSSVDHLEITGDPGRLSVVVKLPPHVHGGGGESNLRLMVPSSARVSLETVSADVTLQGTRGAVQINTVSGDVGVESDAPQIDAHSVSGDLILQGASRVTHVNTVSGDLRLTGMQGELSAESVSGNLELRGGRFSTLRVKSISGDMTLDLSFAQQAAVVGETLSGNITLHVPPGLSGTAMLKSFSGDTQCDMQPMTSSGEGHGGKKREYKFGDGKGVSLELSTFSGDIRLDRGGDLPVVQRPPAPPAPPSPPAPPAPPAPSN